MTELATRVISAIERLDTRSAAVVRVTAYRAMADAGVDVPRLVSAARSAHLQELRARFENSKNRVLSLKARADQVPALQAALEEHKQSPAVRDQVRAMLAAKNTADDIQAMLGVPRPFVWAVRRLEDARAAKRDLTPDRRKLVKAHEERLERFDHRQGWTPAPTKERLRHSTEKPVESVIAGGGKTHQFTWPIDQVRHLLPDDAYLAAERLKLAYDKSQQASKVPGYDAQTTAGNPSGKLALTPEQERYGRDFDAIWSRLPGGVLRRVVRNFVLDQPWGVDAKAMSYVDFGRKFGEVEGEAQARGVAQGAVLVTTVVLAWVARSYDAEVRRRRRQVNQAIYEDRAAFGVLIDADNREAARIRAARQCPGVEPWIVEGCIAKLFADPLPAELVRKASDEAVWGAIKRASA